MIRVRLQLRQPDQKITGRAPAVTGSFCQVDHTVSIFFVSLLPDIPIEGGVKLPAFIVNNKGLHALFKRHSRVYNDKMCLFRCLALFDRQPLKGCERAAKEKFYQYCHERALNPNIFPGVTLRELIDVEDIFEINFMVYAFELDDQSPKATVV